MVLNLGNLHFSKFETKEPHSNCTEHRKRPVHVPGSLHIMVFLYGYWSKSIEVILAKLLGDEQLTFETLTTILDDFLLHKY